MMKQKVVSIVSGILALLLAVGPWTLFQACPTTEKVMKCHWCCRAVYPSCYHLAGDHCPSASD